jgi:hypothetical protein
MIGVEPCFLREIPTLKDFLKKKMHDNDITFNEDCNAKAPWEQYRLKGDRRVDRYVLDVMVTGWLT